MGKNEESAKVTIFFNKMEETDQLGLEPIITLIKDKTKISYDLAKQIPVLTSRAEIWIEAIEAYFCHETLTFYFLRQHLQETWNGATEP